MHAPGLHLAVAEEGKGEEKRSNVAQDRRRVVGDKCADHGPVKTAEAGAKQVESLTAHNYQKELREDSSMQVLFMTMLMLKALTCVRPNTTSGCFHSIIEAKNQYRPIRYIECWLGRGIPSRGHRESLPFRVRLCGA